MNIKVDTKTAKTIRTQPVHQWDSLVFLQFDNSVDAEHCSVHFDMPSGTGTIIDLGAQNTAMIPTDLLETSFDGEIHGRLVKTNNLSETTLCDVYIPVIPCQKAVSR